jgi:hypothetical protein
MRVHVRGSYEFRSFTSPDELLLGCFALGYRMKDILALPASK